MRLLALCLSLFIGLSALAEEPQVYFMAPDYQGGSDGNSGAETSPLATLSGVQKRMRRDQVSGEVIVAIEPYDYFDEPTERYAVTHWNYYQPGQRIRFMSADQYRQEYRGQYVTQIQKPHFFGCPTKPVDRSHALSMCHNNYWLHFQPSKEAFENKEFQVYLEFSNIHISYYNNGLYLGNNYYDTDYSFGLSGVYLPGHRIENMEFSYIGNTYTSALTPDQNWESYTALALSSWGYNIVANNKFTNIEANYKPHFHHGIYVSHNSSFNEIVDNEFHTISGDAIKFRDNSNYNRTFNNKIEFSGNAGYHSWFCRHEYNPADYDKDPGSDGCLKNTYECPSHSNEFFNNTLGLTYDGKDQLVEACHYVGNGKTLRGCRTEEVTWKPEHCTGVLYPRVKAYDNIWIDSNGQRAGDGPRGNEKRKPFSFFRLLMELFAKYYSSSNPG